MRFLVLLLLVISALTARAGIVGKEVTYTSDSLTMKGYLAYDDSLSGRRPGILVVHEWWGNNAYAHKRAEMLAGLGYTALAVDMYGNGRTAEHPDDAGKFSSEVMGNMAVMTARFNAALDFLKQDERVDTAHVAAIGYCFGGGVVLNMARHGANLKAVVSFHGSLATGHPAERGEVKSKILVCNGADDKFIPTEDIQKFKAEMKTANADYQFINYPGAVHGFSNPDATEMGKKFSIKIAYNANADRKSWLEMQKLFKKVFRR